MLDQEQVASAATTTTTKSSSSLSPSKEAVATPTKSSNTHLLCDKVLINYVQDAIKTIKHLRQACDIKSIFNYLREHMPNDEKISKLNEKELVLQLELAVRDGILSRKGNSDWQQKSPVKQAAASPNNSTISGVYVLPDLASDRSKSLNDLLPLLIKSIASLNKQNFGFSKVCTENNEKEFTCSLDSICKYLNEHYKFQLASKQPSAADSKQIQSNLKEFVNYLLTSNEKIFVTVKSSFNGATEFKLNSIYIQKKIKERNQHKNSPNNNFNGNNNNNNNKSFQLTESFSSVSNSPTKSVRKESVPGKNLDVDYILKNLNFKPPYTPEQIVTIESIKRPTAMEINDL